MTGDGVVAVTVRVTVLPEPPQAVSPAAAIPAAASAATPRPTRPRRAPIIPAMPRPGDANRVDWRLRHSSIQSEGMIYCVIPRELEAELFDKMVEYYKDNPNVTVIVDRRHGPDRRNGAAAGGNRVVRDRRRRRMPGTFPDTDAPE